MTKPLSPAAQAVLDAVVYGAVPPFRLIAKPMTAAALRVLADQSENLYDPHEGKVSVIRTDLLLAIAAELEGEQ